jgi:flavin reductase
MTSPASADRERYLDAMSRTATGVTVVTTAGPAGRFGQTVSAMTSVSADPPLLLVCINQRSPICPAIEQHRVFGVNVLRADQRPIAETFAGRTQNGEPYDFAVARWESSAAGSPMLAGAVARFDCALEAIHRAGTHTIYVGRVIATDASGGAPLVYARRGYGELHAFPNRPVPDEPGWGEFDDAGALDLGDL